MGALPGRLQRGGTDESTERQVSMAGHALTMLPKALFSTQVPADHCVKGKRRTRRGRNG